MVSVCCISSSISVYVGDIYEYVPRLVDIDTDISISLELIDAPDWLYLDNGVVMGAVLNLLIHILCIKGV